VRADGGSSREFDVTVGNVTLTTLTGLSPDTQYDFAVAAIAENQVRHAAICLHVFRRRGWHIVGMHPPLPSTCRPPSDARPSKTLTWQTDVEWRHVDLYGRRPLVRHGLVGPYSTRTNLTATLPVDFSFKVRRARRAS
jgi:hypothetical protein